MTHYDTAEVWFSSLDAWQEETCALRAIVLSAELEETVKWRTPCYTDRGKNIALIGVDKDRAVLSLFKGALLKDPEGRLAQAGSLRSARYVPFTSVEEVNQARPYLEALLAQAVEVERAGLRVEPLPNTIDYVDELQQRIAGDEAFGRAFEALSLGRRRQYNFHFAQAKKASTREARITRYTDRILTGKGMRDCVCGHSKRMPSCDGSHRFLEAL